MGTRVISGNERDGMSTECCTDREQGSRDRRMLPVAVIVWAANLLTHYLWTTLMQKQADNEPVHIAFEDVPENKFEDAVDDRPYAASIEDATATNPSLLSIIMLGVICICIAILLVKAIIALLQSSDVTNSVTSVVAVHGRAWKQLIHHCRKYNFSIMIMLAAALISSVATITADTMQWHDPATSLARDGPTSVIVTMRVTSPAITATKRDADCQVDVILQSVSDDVIIQSSHASARVFLSGQACSVPVNTGQYRVSGILQNADYGSEPLWLIGEKSADTITPITRPTLASRVVFAMQQSMFRVCGKLSDQAQVLVPGLTIGILGQDVILRQVSISSDGSALKSGDIAASNDCCADHTLRGNTRDNGTSHDVDSSAANSTIAGSTLTDSITANSAVDNEELRGSPSDTITSIGVDDTYAETLEDRFRRSGIMHLMAVSGGHFMIIAGLARKLCARLLAHRWVTAMAMCASNIILAAVVFPSDSVLRALIMGCMAAVCLGCGRRGQTLSALCWTTITVLIISPDMARSYGFALSCAAVLGIALAAQPLQRGFAIVLPDMLAEATAMTIAAQLFTLPIQVLMEPELPVLSILANVIVAPFVGFATLCGLASLMVSWLSPDIGYGMAWVAGCGTRVMERCAMWLGGSQYAIVPWAGDLLGVVLMMIVEGAIAVGVGLGARIARRRSALYADSNNLTHSLDTPGASTFPRRPRERIARWLSDTLNMFNTGHE